MLCICHSLGGTILKQALCVVNEKLYRYEPLINSMSGIVLLGTPHLGSNQAEILDKICMVLELAIKNPPKPLVGRVAEENAFYPDLSKSFEEFSCRTPILSVYEVETRISEFIDISRAIRRELRSSLPCYGPVACRKSTMYHPRPP